MLFIKCKLINNRKLAYFNLEHVVLISEDVEEVESENIGRVTVRAGKYNSSYKILKHSIEVVDIKPKEYIGFLSQEDMEM